MIKKINLEHVNVYDVAEIDFFGENNSLKEYKIILDKISFTVETEKGITPCSELNFKEIIQVCEQIKTELYLSENEIEDFEKICDMALNGSNVIPPEMITANLIHNKYLALSYSDIQNLPVKTFEKIQIALKKIKEKFSF